MWWYKYTRLKIDSCEMGRHVHFHCHHVAESRRMKVRVWVRSFPSHLLRAVRKCMDAHFIFTRVSNSCIFISEAWFPAAERSCLWLYLCCCGFNVCFCCGGAAAFIFSAGEKMDLISDLSALCQMWQRQSALTLFPPLTVSTVTWHNGTLPKYSNTKWNWNKINK